MGDAGTGTGTANAGTLSFSRRSRLLHPAEFQRVFSKAGRSADRYYTILFRPRELAAGEACSRVGFAIAKKRVARAVGRNRIRRIARESFRHNCHLLPPLDIIVMCKDAAGNASNKELFASLDQHWQRLVNKNQGTPDNQNKRGSATPRKGP